MKKTDINSRIHFIGIFAYIYMGILMIAFFNIQILRNEEILEKSENQHYHTETLKQTRGDIYTSDNTLIATNKKTYDIWANPSIMINPQNSLLSLLEAIPEKILFNMYLSNLSNEDYLHSKTDLESVKTYFKELYEPKLKKSLQYSLLFSNIDEEVYTSIFEKKIDGIFFDQTSTRYYPQGKNYSEAIGFIAKDNSGLAKGYLGIEGYYEGLLRGRPGLKSEERTATGALMLIGNSQMRDKIDGANLKLTIDSFVQNVVEKNIKEAVNNYNALSGSVVVLDPKTGKILALSSYPTFDPNDPLKSERDNKIYKQQTPSDSIRNESIKDSQLIARSYQSAYEPGSIIKPLTVATALENNKIDLNTPIYDNGILVVDEYKIDNWDKKHHGTITAKEVLALSNNVGSATIGDICGRELLYTYFKKFGIGESTNIDLLGEEAGFFKNHSTWSRIDTMNVAFGQGFLSTPLQLTSAFSVFANDGMISAPFITQEITEDGETKIINPATAEKVLSKETNDKMLDLLTNAVDVGESKYFNLKEFKIAGKTGTAQIFEKNKYQEDLTNATFVGFFANNPRFVLLVTLNRPLKSIYAAETAVPTWMKIASELAIYFKIEPDKIDT